MKFGKEIDYSLDSRLYAISVPFFGKKYSLCGLPHRLYSGIMFPWDSLSTTMRAKANNLMKIFLLAKKVAKWRLLSLFVARED